MVDTAKSRIEAYAWEERKRFSKAIEVALAQVSVVQKKEAGEA